jgi:hypothetical protein
MNPSRPRSSQNRSARATSARAPGRSRSKPASPQNAQYQAPAVDDHAHALGPKAGVGSGSDRSAVQWKALTSREARSPAAYCRSAVRKKADVWSMLRLPK